MIAVYETIRSCFTPTVILAVVIGGVKKNLKEFLKKKNYGPQARPDAITMMLGGLALNAVLRIPNFATGIAGGDGQPIFPSRVMSLQDVQSPGLMVRIPLFIIVWAGISKPIKNLSARFFVNAIITHSAQCAGHRGCVTESAGNGP
jgi:hypothetical protein